MKKILLFLSLLLPLSVAAQSYTISGKVLNQTTGEVVDMATVRLFSYQGADSTLVQGLQTDMQGQFKLTAKDGQYAVIISSVGFLPKKVKCTVAGKDLALRPIQLKEDVLALGEVQVQGHAAEMTVKGDTIEYNTSAYKVGENAMVEDLLKKMNGVTVDKEGNVTVNGETIKGVRIDGKKFFGSDVQSATKNIPADMIDKIHHLDKKVTIGLVGKYVQLHDAYLSVAEALQHAGFAEGVKVNIDIDNSIGITGEFTVSDTFKFLPHAIELPLLPGINLSWNPSMNISISVKISATFKNKVHFELYANTDKKCYHDQSVENKGLDKLEISGTLTLGFNLLPGIDIISSDVINVKPDLVVSLVIDFSAPISNGRPLKYGYCPYESKNSTNTIYIVKNTASVGDTLFGSKMCN